MAKKVKARDPYKGRWRIVSMSAWEDEYLDEEVEAHIEFDGKGGGFFQFGYVQGFMDCRLSDRGGKPAVEFCWEGGDLADGTPMTGRGWAILADGGLSGMLFIHGGDDSEFLAERSKAKRADGRPS